MDTQQVEIIGKHLLIANLMAAEIEIAEPIRDRGIDLIAFSDGLAAGKFFACPIQLKTSTKEGFGLYQKYDRFPELKIVYVWHAASPKDAQFFVLTYRDALGVLEKMRYDQTDSWKKGKRYITTRPSTELKDSLALYRVTSLEQWTARLGLTASRN